MNSRAAATMAVMLVIISGCPYMSNMVSVVICLMAVCTHQHACRCYILHTRCLVLQYHSVSTCDTSLHGYGPHTCILAL